MKRNTKTKKAVTQILISTPTPLGIDEIFSKLIGEFPKTAFSTVFRIVKALETEKKVVKVDWRDRGSKYEWSDRKHHHHIICDDCGFVNDLDDDTAGFKPKRISQRTGFILNNHFVEITGTCPDCQKTT